MRCVWCLSRRKTICGHCIVKLKKSYDIFYFTNTQCNEEIEKINYAIDMILRKLYYTKLKMKEWEIPLSYRINRLYEHTELLLKRLERIRKRKERSLTTTTKEG